MNALQTADYTSEKRTFDFLTSGPLRHACRLEVEIEWTPGSTHDSWSGYTCVAGKEQGCGERVALEIRHPRKPFTHTYSIWSWNKNTGSQAIAWYDTLEEAIWNCARTIACH